MLKVTLHVSVWVEIVSLPKYCFFILSRSTWACELKYRLSAHRLPFQGHAPRERVSWNLLFHLNQYKKQVTLHVSVWVEISRSLIVKISLFVTLHVSVWVEITDKQFNSLSRRVTLHVSVWIEMLKLSIVIFKSWSRSTWACELKFFSRYSCSLPFTSRSTWACELKLDVGFIYRMVRMSRSTWACELKFLIIYEVISFL